MVCKAQHEQRQTLMVLLLSMAFTLSFAAVVVRFVELVHEGNEMHEVHSFELYVICSSEHRVVILWN